MARTRTGGSMFCTVVRGTIENPDDDDAATTILLAANGMLETLTINARYANPPSLICSETNTQGCDNTIKQTFTAK